MTYTETVREVELAMINKLQSGTYGDFAASLGKAYELADLGNRKKLKAAFPDIFDMAQDAALLELLGDEKESLAGQSVPALGAMLRFGS